MSNKQLKLHFKSQFSQPVNLVCSKTDISRPVTLRYMADKKSFTLEEAKEVGEKLGILWDRFDVEQFRMGMDVELEHGSRDPHTNVTNNDSLTTGKIALAHLNEFPDYYDRLDKLEEEAKAYWKAK